MKLEEIYNSKKINDYLKAHLDGVFIEDFLVKRKINKEITDIDKLFILKLISDENKKWFIASYIQTVENFDIEIFEKIMEVGLNTKDPSYNAFFISPCIRVFGCIKAIEFLEQKFKNGYENLDRILNAVYHIRSKIMKIGRFTNDGQIKWTEEGFEYKWNSERFCYEIFSKDVNRKMENEELKKYRIIHYEFIKRKRELILNVTSNNLALQKTSKSMREKL